MNAKTPPIRGGRHDARPKSDRERSVNPSRDSEFPVSGSRFKLLEGLLIREEAKEQRRERWRRFRSRTGSAFLTALVGAAATSVIEHLGGGVTWLSEITQRVWAAVWR